ncbi:MAG TPA: efflux transporter periplasmic adaptor subunit [Betaproteobacteria bacterium]|nr:efflux transporter periplasmic adaptor subunit [Betaproteobacteria bacterium]
MTKRMVVMLILVGVLFGGIFGFQAFKAHMIGKFMAARGAPTQTVSTIQASERVWQPHLDAVGSLRAVHGADLAPEVAGIVSRINFKSGETVKAGALLAALDATADKAKLQSLQATEQLARKTLVRDRQQFKSRAISQATLDTDIAKLKSAQAQVAEQRALVAKKSIRAPFAGRLGIRAVDLGQYLNPGAKIVTLQALNPIFLDFYVPQKAIGQVRVGQHVLVKTDAFPGRTFAGKISAIDPKADRSTRNVEVRAMVRNPKRLLLPGAFAVAKIDIGRAQRHITLPQTAISYNPYGDVVFLVEHRGKGAKGKPKWVARQRFVTLGQTRGDQVAILRGVKAGDVVVTAGQIKLRNGTPVAINNTIEPANDAAPQPKDE